MASIGSALRGEVNVHWSDEALKDRGEVRAYISLDNPVAAARLDRSFSAVIENLEAFPHLGRVGRLPGTREVIPHPNYRIIYEVRENLICILAIVHTARRWPPFRE